MIFPVLQRNGEIGEITVPGEGNRYIELSETDNGDVGAPTYRISFYCKETLVFALDKKRECYVDIYISEAFAAQFISKARARVIQEHLAKYYAWIFTYGRRRIIK